MLSDDRKYQAILEKDASFEGIFFTAVKTTGIFCRPTCTARKPKRENVEFFSTIGAAIRHGYRPCKVCEPTKFLHEIPKQIQSLLNDIEASPSLRIKDSDLMKRGIEPHTVRRWFKKHYNMTFQTYQRMFRLNHAFTSIQKGESVTSSAFDAGFESLSGFNERFRAVFEQSPRNARTTTILHSTRINTPLGQMLACASSEGLCLLEFLDRRMLENEIQDIVRRLRAVILPGTNPHLKRVEQELDEYFHGNRRAFSVQLHTPGTEFQYKVWSSIQTIPFGSTITYKEQATSLESPRAVRSIAHANGLNRVAIVIPCHRVIGENGELKGYGGGLFRKQWLLNFEKQICTTFHPNNR